jgi:ABC-2 type transport system permease protein
MGIGIIGGVLIYFFVFMYGAQVLRSVIEEKNSRIVELIISSVKPVQLMLGKIIGVALVGLTQFLLWVVLTFAIVSAGKSIIFPEQTLEEIISTGQYEKGGTSSQIGDQPVMADQGNVRDMLESLGLVNYGLIIGAFLFFFLLGYLLYSSLFAAIGAAVDNDTDTQQFMLPLTIPLIISFVMIQVIINNPDGAISFWFSIIPLTSPVVMMVRIPYGVPVYEAALAAGLLLVSVVLSIWLAAKIYRTGILMYGKKVSYREIWKWLRYKN